MKVFIYDNGLNLENYVNAVKICGNEPILNKDVTLSYDCDALLLTGGGDVISYLYNKPLTTLKNVDAVTDLAETFLINKFVLQKKKIIGVCKGMQILNVYFGGTLKNVDYHFMSGKDLYHLVSSATASPLQKVMGEGMLVNSCHRQAIDELGEGLKILYTSIDNTAECITHNTLPILAVQFHPERMAESFIKNFYSYAFNYQF